MPLRLTIENMDRLPDGGPLRVQVESRGLDIGRDQHLDWTLPDPSRHVSSKHCEIRFRDGGYWLHDVSTNGTFVNGAQFRLEAPHLLRSGDRLSIGQYIVAVEVEGLGAAAPAYSPAFPAPQGSSDLWGGEGEAAAPDDRRNYLPERLQKPAPDFLDFASGVAPAEFASPSGSSAGPGSPTPVLRHRFPCRRTIGCAARSSLRPFQRRRRSRRRRAGRLLRAPPQFLMRKPRFRSCCPLTRSSPPRRSRRLRPIARL